MVSVPERELTCSICTDILFDPVTFIKCQHTNCGACAKAWFRQNDTCPVCRQKVEDVGVNSTIKNLVEWFLEENPDKRRTEAEIAESRKNYKPGDPVLDPVGQLHGSHARPDERLDLPTEQELEAVFRAGFGAFPQPRAYQSPPEVARVGFRELGLMMQAMSDRNEDIRDPLRTINPLFRRMSTTIGSAFVTRGEPRSLGELVLQTGNGPINVTCNACSGSIDSDLHYECTTCSMYHLCLRCYRTGQTCPTPSHIMLPQRLIPATPSQHQHLRTGVFCSICEEWTDEDRNSRTEAPRSFFWHCETCNNGHWTYCRGCVQRGRCCSHPLTQWTNSRVAPNTVRPDPTQLLIRGPKRETILNAPAMNSAGRGWLISRGYQRWERYGVSCDSCHRNIALYQGWWHCVHCSDGRWNVCIHCNLNRYHGLCSSMGGHSPLRMEAPRGEPSGTIRYVDAVEVQRPDIVDPSAQTRTAVAVHSVWAGNEEAEGGMRWGQSNGHLWFPAGARINNVTKVFDESGVPWFWGTYAGTGGIFDGRAVRLMG